jgi:HEAT repeat protein
MPLIRKPPGTSPTAPPPATGDLGSASPEARWAAARALATPADIPALAAALREERDPRVREAILTSLGRIGGAAAAEAVVPHIRSDDAGLRTAALDALHAMPEAMASSLAGLLDDADPDVRLLACDLLRALPGVTPTRLLCDLLERESEPNVCAAAIEVLAEVGGPDALPTLARCAERYAALPFLAFSIRVAIERIGAKSLG